MSIYDAYWLRICCWFWLTHGIQWGSLILQQSPIIAEHYTHLPWCSHGNGSGFCGPPLVSVHRTSSDDVSISQSAITFDDTLLYCLFFLLYLNCCFFLREGSNKICIILCRFAAVKFLSRIVAYIFCSISGTFEHTLIMM